MNTLLYYLVILNNYLEWFKESKIDAGFCPFLN